MTNEGIGKRITAYRKSRGFKTAAALADAIDNPSMTTAVIQNIESGRKADVTVAQLMDIAFTLKVSPVFLIVPVNRPMDRFEYPNVGDSVGSMINQDALAFVSARKNGPDFSNPTEAYLRNAVYYAEQLREAEERFPFAAAAASNKEAIEEYEEEDPSTGQVWIGQHDPNEANEYLASQMAIQGESAYRYLEQRPRFDLSWAKCPWRGTVWLPGDEKK